MGTWGPGIFQNDVADDLKRVYIEKLKLGKSDDEALSETISYLADYAEDEEDSIDFWLGLASVMFDYGRLTDPIKKKALQIIDSSVDLERWDECDKKRRQVIIVELKDKLNSEQPERKKVSVAKRKIPEIKPNDIWCFKLKCKFRKNSMPIPIERHAVPLQAARSDAIELLYSDLRISLPLHSKR